MKRNSIILFCVFITNITNAQNLIFNGDFEMKSACPTDLSQILYAIHWQNINNATTDYFNACDTTNKVSVPINRFDKLSAHNGNAYVGIVCGDKDKVRTNYKEFLFTELLDKLVKDEQYIITYYVNLPKGSKYYTSELQVSFYKEYPRNIKFYSFVTDTTENIIRIPVNLKNIDKNGWIKCTATFTATGNEKYLLLGNNQTNDKLQIDTNKNFDPSILKKYIKVDKTESSIFAYYFIDNISLVPLNKSLHTQIPAQNYWLDSIYNYQTFMMEKLHFEGGVRGYLKYVEKNLKKTYLPIVSREFITDCQVLVVKYSLNSEYQIVDYAIDHNAQPHFYNALTKLIEGMTSYAKGKTTNTKITDTSYIFYQFLNALYK